MFNLVGWRVLVDVERHQFIGVSTPPLVRLRIVDGARQPHDATDILNIIAAYQITQRCVGGSQFIKGDIATEFEIEMPAGVWLRPGDNDDGGLELVFLQDGSNALVISSAIIFTPDVQRRQNLFPSGSACSGTVAAAQGDTDIDVAAFSVFQSRKLGG